MEQFSLATLENLIFHLSERLVHLSRSLTVTRRLQHLILPRTEHSFQLTHQIERATHPSCVSSGTPTPHLLLPSEVKLLNNVSKHRDEAHSFICQWRCPSCTWRRSHLGLPEELITGSARSSWTAGLPGWLELGAPPPPPPPASWTDLDLVAGVAGGASLTLRWSSSPK